MFVYVGLVKKAAFDCFSLFLVNEPIRRMAASEPVEGWVTSSGGLRLKQMRTASQAEEDCVKSK